MNPVSPAVATPSAAVGLAVYGALVLGLLAVLLGLSSRVGARNPGPEKERPYESGVIPTGPARLGGPVPFYLVAIFFLVFDVEVAFVLLWASSFEALGWAGWVHMAIFVGVLLAGLGYVWGKGGLDWGAGGNG